MNMKLVGVVLIWLPVFLAPLVLPAQRQSGLRVDTQSVYVRSFDAEALENYRNNPVFQYKQAAPKPNWFQRMLRSFLDWLDGRPKTTKVLGQGIFYGLMTVGLLFIVLGLLRIKISSFFAKGAANSAWGLSPGQDNIEEIDFEKLIRDALANGDYRKALRLLYLECLKVLSVKGWIVWKPNKTNTDYKNELKETLVATYFEKLSETYEYVWYGQFPLDSNQYQSFSAIYQEFQTAVTNEFKHE